MSEKKDEIKINFKKVSSKADLQEVYNYDVDVFAEAGDFEWSLKSLEAEKSNGWDIYSVISPEGCASILWKSADRASDAAKAMGITAQRLQELGLVDTIVPEPLGGAHIAHEQIAQSLKENVLAALDRMEALTTEELLARRYNRLMSYGL